MKIWRYILIGFISFCFFLKGNSQNNSDSHNLNITIPEVALLGLVSEQGENMNLVANSPLEAGNIVTVDNTKEKSIWINYSSIIKEQNQRRKVVAFVQGNIPSGINIKLEASNYQGSGKGNLGEPSGIISLSNEPSEIIGDIGSCYTGKGANNGHKLTYKLEIDDSANSYAMLTQQQTSINVVYTLTD